MVKLSEKKKQEERQKATKGESAQEIVNRDKYLTAADAELNKAKTNNYLCK